MATYTIEPGRHIYRDGAPFVYVTYSVNPETSVRSASPAEADSFARHIAACVNACEQMRAVLSGTEWDSGTLNDIARILIDAGFTLEDY